MPADGPGVVVFGGEAEDGAFFHVEGGEAGAAGDEQRGEGT